MELFYIYAFIKLSIQVSHWINSGFKGLGDKNRSNCLLVKISKKCHPFVFNHDPPPSVNEISMDNTQNIVTWIPYSTL